MKQCLSAVSIIVSDYDKAIDFYCQKLGFELLEDIDQGRKRWVTVRPKGATETQIVLAQASNEAQQKLIGQQGADRVWLFLQTDDFYRDHKAMLAKGVKFLESPREEPYGIVAVFEDEFGNKWDLIEKR
ncbi:VOC family protein [Planctobacterium marinum]|uniref:Extradiol dioxygenase n=1 Tax=Planctobacterium marinum TaxID=1631968 RepID=A0AA48I9H3_9ALTE|nr:extradiol dioxygenase [Planctobacterium marinum]